MLDSVISQLRHDGFEISEVIPDGKIHRFKRSPQDRNPDCWYVCYAFNGRHGDQAFTIIYSDWHSADVYKYCSIQPHGQDRELYEKQIQKAQKDAEKAREVEYEACAAESKVYLAGLGSELTPYAKTKRLPNLFGAFNSGQDTIIPCGNGYQIIYPDGTKRFKLHTKKKGSYFTIKGNPKTWLTEGWATGCTVHMATGDTVVVCFDAGNIPEVKKAFPDAILAGDNDEAGKKYPGIFPDQEGYDWNDVYCEFGIEAVQHGLAQEPEQWVRPLGYKDDTYFYTSSSNRQIVALPASAHTEAHFFHLMPQEYWKSAYPQKTGYKDAASELMGKCRKLGIFNPKNVRGSGVWKDETLAVNCGGFVYPKHPKSKYTYIISNPIPPPGPVESDPAILLDILTCINWKVPEHGKLLAGWLAIAPFSGALQWRPHLWITGCKGAGKSVVVDKIIGEVLGDYKIYPKSNSTEAGIRQTLGHNALPIIFDEFEQMGDKSDERNKAVLDLFRQASFESGGEIIKGSSGGNSVPYSPRFCALVASIRINLENDADRSRFTVLDLDIPKNNYDEFQKKIAVLTPEYSVGLFTYFYNRWAELDRKIHEIYNLLCANNTARFAQQHAPLIAGYAMFNPNWSLDEFKFANHEDEKDEESCLDHLMGSMIKVELAVTRERPIQECINYIQNETTSDVVYHREALERHGIRVSDGGVFIAGQHSLLKKIYRDSRWARGWVKSLSRIDGTTSTVVKMNGKSVRGCRIPIDRVIEL